MNISDRRPRDTTLIYGSAQVSGNISFSVIPIALPRNDITVTSVIPVSVIDISLTSLSRTVLDISLIPITDLGITGISLVSFSRLLIGVTVTPNLRVSD